MSWSCELEVASIVLLGKFNPSIFQPAWLAANSLIRKEEAEPPIVNIEVIHRDVCVFNADWLNLQVTQNRFAATALDAVHQGELRDLVLGIFALLEHTPFDKMGMNRDMHFRMDSRDRWHAFGDLLAPKGCWKPIMERAGLRSLVMENQRDEVKMPKLTVKIEPSPRVSPGVYIGTNAHHEAGAEDPGAARELLRVLKDSWEATQSEARTIAEHLLNQEY